MHEAGGEPLGAERGDGAERRGRRGRRPGRARRRRRASSGRSSGRRGGGAPSVSPRAARRWKLPMRMWLWLRRTSTEERVGEGSSPRVERLAGLDQREGLRGVDAERLEHLGGEDLAHAALQRQPAVAAARPGRRARALGAEVEQAAVDEVAHLGEEEAAAVAEVGVVDAELVAVVAQRQRLGEAAGQRLEAAEVAGSSRRRRGRRGRSAPPSGRCGSAAASRGRRPGGPGRRRPSPRRGVDVSGRKRASAHGAGICGRGRAAARRRGGNLRPGAGVLAADAATASRPRSQGKARKG